MAESTVQYALSEGHYGRVLTAFNDVQEHINRKEIKFPQLVVIGDESAGKSSLMQAICKVPLPKGRKLTTRAVMNVRLRHGPRKIKTWMTYRGSSMTRNEREVKDEENLEDVILKMQQSEIDLQNEAFGEDKKRGFMEDPITIEICDEDNPDLTLVDLPGYFMYTGNDDNRVTGEDVKFIEKVLTEYLEDSSSILLIVVPASIPIGTVNVLNFIKKFMDSLGDLQKENLKARTIYCLTKCDLVNDEAPPEDIKRLLNNEGMVNAAPHNWYPVVNNLSRLDSRKKGSLEKDREMEKQFFERAGPYSEFKNRCGIPNLVRKLTKVLWVEIKLSIPRIRPELDMKISAFRAKQRELGPEKPKPDHDSGLDEIVDDIKTLFEDATSGKTLALYQLSKKNHSNLTEEEFVNCQLSRLRSVRIEAFKDDIHELRPGEDGTTRDDSETFKGRIETMMEIAVDGVLQKALPNKTVAENVLREMALKWKELAEVMYHDIAEKAESCLKLIIRARVGQFKNLPDVLCQLAEKIIEEQKNAALTRLQWHYVDEIGWPDTMNQQFTDELEKLDPPGLSNKKGSTSDTFMKVFTAIFPVIENRFIDNAVRTVTTHIFGVPVNRIHVRNDRAEKFKHKFTPGHVRRLLSEKIPEGVGEDISDYLFELKDDRERKHKGLQKKIEELEKLRSVLDSKPSELCESVSVPDDASVITDSLMNGAQTHLPGFDD